MRLEAKTQQKLNEWVSGKSWYLGFEKANHDRNRFDRFYDFVYQYYLDHGLIQETKKLEQQIKNEILKCKTELTNPNLDDIISYFVELAVRLCEYTHHVKI